MANSPAASAARTRSLSIRLSPLRVWIALLLGGMLGGMLRATIQSALPTQHAQPWDVLAINLGGSLLLGTVNRSARASLPEWLRVGITVGAIGSFTTFSTFCLVAATFASPRVTMLYIAATTAGGPLSAYCGEHLAWDFRRRVGRVAEEVR